MTGAVKILRGAGALVVNLFAAMLIPNFFNSDFSHIFRQRTLTGLLFRDYAISAVAAVSLGYFVYYKWRSSAAKWVWIPGALWFAWQAVSIWQEQAHRYSVLVGQPGSMSVTLHIFGPVPIPRQTVYAFMLIRTLCYSIGAWACWFSIKEGGAPFASLRQSLRALR